MESIVWNDKLSVGVEGIDSDHQRLVDLLNDLHEAIRARRGRVNVLSHLDELIDYTCYHFSHEEGMFGEDYSEAEEHKAEHQNFVAWLKGMQSRFAHGNAGVPSLEAVSFLKDWLFHHILVCDRDLGAHLHAAGISLAAR